MSGDGIVSDQPVGTPAPEIENIVSDQPVGTPAPETENIVSDQKVDGQITEAVNKKNKRNIDPVPDHPQMGGEDIVDFLINGHFFNYVRQINQTILGYAKHIESGIQARREKRNNKDDVAKQERDNLRKANEAYVEKKGQLKAGDKDNKKQGLQAAADLSKQNASEKSWLGRTHVGQLVAGIRGRIQYNRIYREQLNNAALGRAPEAGIASRANQIYQDRHGRNS